MVLYFYCDLYSQPARSVWLFLKLHDIPFQTRHIDLFKQEHKSPEYKKIVSSCLISAIEDDGFVLTECVAILQYLHRKYVLTQSSKAATIDWYPEDLKTRARVDEYMSWQHTGTRKGGMDYVNALGLSPLVSMAATSEQIKASELQLQEKLNYLESHFLDKGPFIAGSGATLADLMAITEVMQPLAAGYNVTNKHPKIAEWMERLKQVLGPLFTEAHQVLLQQFSPKTDR